MAVVVTVVVMAALVRMSPNEGALPLITPWPTTFDAVSVPWPSIPGSKSPLHARKSPEAGVSVSPKSVGTAGDRRVAVRDVIEQTAREVGVAVPVQVAIRDRRALRHRLLVPEAEVVVQIDVDRVVLAGRVRVGDENRGPLAVELRAGTRPGGWSA